MVECEFPELSYTMGIDCRFNRYMVECEFCTTRNGKKVYDVLIDTWWNVNSSCTAL